jgi:hypothetical protein
MTTPTPTKAPVKAAAPPAPAGASKAAPVSVAAAPVVKPVPSKSIKDRFPHLFNTYALDEGGRPKNAPTKDNPSALAVAGPRVATAAELIRVSLGTFGILVTPGQAAQVASDLAEFSKLPAPIVAAPGARPGAPSGPVPGQAAAPPAPAGRKL